MAAREQGSEDRESALSRVGAQLARSEEANRRKDEFLAILSHEMRTPLNALLTWTEVLRGDEVDRQSRQSALSSIERSVKVLARMIDDLLDTSRIISGKLSLELQDCDLAAIARNAIDAARSAAEEKGVHLQHEIGAENIPMRGDPVRLQEVVGNLLSNAVKFTAAGGKVRVEVRRPANHAEILVGDTGEGIAADFLPHVFEPFIQGSGEAAKRRTGLGLGLSITKHLVELHGGTIQVDSAGVGLGSEFRIRLPVGRSAEYANEAAEASGDPVKRSDHQLSSVKVLIVDDDEDSALALETLLRSQGAAVQRAGSVRDTLGAFRELRPDVVLTDLTLPDEDGYALLAALQKLQEKQAESHRVPVIALTGSARIEDRQRVAAAGFALHLTKPVDPTEILAAVSMCAQGRGREFAATRRKTASDGR